MALEHAILVSLSEKPSTGYDLARRFDASIGYFWTATHQQIYRVLAAMEDSGWVTATLVPQPSRPDKKVYEPTAAGRAELAEWLGRPAEPERPRSDLAVKIRGVSEGDPAEVRREVARHRMLHAERLDVYLATERRDFPQPTALEGRQLHQWLVLQGGIARERSMLGWCDLVLAALDSGSSGQRPDEGGVRA